MSGFTVTKPAAPATRRRPSPVTQRASGAPPSCRPGPVRQAQVGWRCPPGSLPPSHLSLAPLSPTARRTCSGTLVSAMSPMPGPPSSLSPNASKMPSSRTAKELRRVTSFERARSRVLARGPWVSRRGVWVYICYRAWCSSLALSGRTDELLPSSLSRSLARSRTHTLSLSRAHTQLQRHGAGLEAADRSAVVCVCVRYSCRDGGPADDRRRTTWPIEDSPTVRFWVRGSLLCESRLIVMIRSGSPSLFCRSSGSMGSLFPTSSGPVACRGPEVSLARRGEKRWRRTVNRPARTENAGHAAEAQTGN